MRMAIPGNIFGQLLSTDLQSRLEVILYIGAFCVATLVDNVESVKSVLLKYCFSWHIILDTPSGGDEW